MEKLKERLKRVRKQDILLWVLIVICLLWMLLSGPPDERRERGRLFLFLLLFNYCIRKNREKQ